MRVKQTWFLYYAASLRRLRIEQKCKNMKRVRAGIIGGAGYTGGETIRLLINHPAVDIRFIHSKSNAGKPVATIHEDLAGDTELTFDAEWHGEIDVVFLCLGHGEAKKFLAEIGTSFDGVL